MDQLATTEESGLCGIDLTTHVQGAHIDIWVTGGVRIFDCDSKGNKVDVLGKKLGQFDDQFYVIARGNLPWGEFAHVIAHEIGHNMTKDGDPDSLDYSGPRLSTLDHSRRLMCSGYNTNWSDPGIQLVKGEWDLIEDWLKEVIK